MEAKTDGGATGGLGNDDDGKRSSAELALVPVTSNMFPFHWRRGPTRSMAIGSCKVRALVTVRLFPPLPPSFDLKP